MNQLEKSYHLFNVQAEKFGPKIPFTDSYNVRKRLRGSKSILDVGCGKGSAMISLNSVHQFSYAVGVDRHEPYLQCCKLNHTHTDIVEADIRKLPFMSGSFDSVICLEVLEHLEKNEGIDFLKQIENIARNGVIVALPIGHYGQHAYDDNPFQEHRSQWNPKEMRKLGYTVTVSSVRGIGGEWRGRGGVWLLLDIPYRLVSVAIIPIVAMVPQIAGHMICYKQIRHET